MQKTALRTSRKKLQNFGKLLRCASPVCMMSAASVYVSKVFKSDGSFDAGHN